MGVLLLGAAVLAAHLVTALRVGGRVASLGEARLAASVFAARRPDVPTDPLPWADRFAARQLAVVETLLPVGDAVVVDAARWACLAVGAVAALLVWPLLRGMPGFSAPAAALGVAVIGIAPPALDLHAGVAAAGPAALWLTVAAVLAVRARSVPVVAAVVVAVVAALTSPLAGAALLAFAAHALLSRTVVPLPGSVRVPVAIALLAVGLGITAATMGSGPLSGTGGPVIDTAAAVTGAVGGLVLIGLGWWRARWLRPLFTAAALLLAVLLVPGPSRAAAALIVLPILAVTVGVLADDLLAHLTGTPRTVTVRAGAVLVLVALVVAVLPGRVPESPPRAALATWANTELSGGVALRADLLDRAELVTHGFPVARVRGPADPVGPDELLVVADRPAGVAAEPVGCPGGAVAAVERGTGGAPTRVCRPDATAVEAVLAERPARARLGAALVVNPALQIAPAAQDALRAGDVDARVVLVLAAMASVHRMTVADFPVAELDTPEVPRRRMVISDVDGLVATAEPLPALRSWLDGQQPPFAPSTIRPTGADLLIGFSAPTQAGLLPP